MERFLDGRVTLFAGDCRDVLATLPADSVDSACCDPPYHLTSIVKRFGSGNSAPAQFGSDGRFARASAGFMGKQWDGGDVAFRPDVWREVYRVLKPGAYIVAFSSSRTYHRMACAIEDAGFITHPLIAWITGQGFPKAHSVSKHIDRMAGAEQEVVGRYQPPNGKAWNLENDNARSEVGAIGHSDRAKSLAITAPVTDNAKQWDGWYYGTQSLKPAIEPIYVGQKPFEEGLNGTQNVLKWGTGAINVGACRVAATDGGWTWGTRHKFQGASDNPAFVVENKELFDRDIKSNANGRWPANVIHDGSEEVVAAFPDVNCGYSDGTKNGAEQSVFGQFDAGKFAETYGDSGSAARFFYTSKADGDDRLGSRHPTVKPLDLICYLVRLFTPRGGLCLDCFAGTGTLGEAAWREGMRAVLIECEAEYQNDIRRRMKLASTAGPGERKWESAKARTAGKPRDDGPLFGSGLCSTCGFPRSEHHYNGACYGVCGDFVERCGAP